MIALWWLFPGVQTSGDTSRSPAVSVSLGGAARISCAHGVPSNPVVYWYKHSRGTAPHLILYSYSDYDRNHRLRMTAEESSRSTVLSISGAETEDSGVYYCAATHTVVGNTKRPKQKLAGQGLEASRLGWRFSAEIPAGTAHRQLRSRFLISAYFYHDRLTKYEEPR